MTRASSLDVARLRWSAQGRMILDGVDCSAPAGAVTGVLGPNGSGKSTLLRMLVGALAPDAGALLLSGEDLRALTRRERAQRLALVEQESPPDVPLSAMETVLLGRTPHRSRWDGDSPSDLALAHDSLERVGAGSLADRAIGTLSGGERQRVHLARALAQQPRLLLLDEPTNHLDIAAQLALLKLLRSLQDVTCVVALHDLDHALRACDHVIVMDAGRVVAAGDPADVLTTALLARVYGVQARVISHEWGSSLVFAEALADHEAEPAS